MPVLFWMVTVIVVHIHTRRLDTIINLYEVTKPGCLQAFASRISRC
jgi:hypothetical protein